MAKPVRPSILIVHSDRKTQRVVQRILGVVGHAIDVADDFDQGIRLIQHLQPVLIVVDGSAVTTAKAAEFFAAAKARGAEAVMSLIGASAFADALPSILATNAITNLLVHP